MYPLLAQDYPPNGYTWTIASRVGHAMKVAQQLFGPHNSDYFYAGHEFHPTGPRVWYPVDQDTVIMQLSVQCMQDPNEAVYELAHEVVHLLAPHRDGNATNLEEGLAEWFSREYVTNEATIHMKFGEKPCYQKASDAVGRLLQENRECIREMRKREPKTWLITPELIREICPKTTVEEAEYLTSAFIPTT